jgi:hypothetical protein
MKTKNHKFTQSGGVKGPISIENDKHSRVELKIRLLPNYKM